MYKKEETKANQDSASIIILVLVIITPLVIIPLIITVIPSCAPTCTRARRQNGNWGR